MTWGLGERRRRQRRECVLGARRRAISTRTDEAHTHVFVRKGGGALRLAAGSAEGV